MDRMPQPGDIYRDLSGELYRIITLAEHADRKEQLVVYQALGGEMRVYALPPEDFSENITSGKKGRFTLVPVAGVEPAISGKEAGFHRLPETEAQPAQGETARGNADTAQGIKVPPGQGQTEPEGTEEFVLDPKLFAFLEADSYEKKLEIFASLAGNADEAMLNTIAVSLDLELSGDTLEEQYVNLKNCLLMFEKYECNRLR